MMGKQSIVKMPGLSESIPIPGTVVFSHPSLIDVVILRLSVQLWWQGYLPYSHVWACHIDYHLAAWSG